MNIFAFSSILIHISSLILSFFLILKGRGRKVAHLWAIFCLSASVWGLGAYGFSTTSSKESALLWWQIATSGSIVAPAIFYHFVYLFLGLKKKHHRYILFSSYALCLLFLVYDFVVPKLFLGDIKFLFNQFYFIYWPTHRNIVYLAFFVVFYWLLLGYSFISLLRVYRHAKGTLRNQLKYFVVASIIGWLGPHGNFLPVFGISIYPYSNFFIAIYPIIFTYAIIKYRLMDVKVAITRASIFILVYTLVLGLPFVAAAHFKTRFVELSGINWWLFPLGLMAVLATAGPFIYIYLQRRAEDRLLKEQKRYQETLKHASVGMTRIRSLKKLLELITHIVTKSVRISYASVYLLDEENGEYLLQATRGNEKTNILKLNSNNPLVYWLATRKESLVYDEIKRHADETANEKFIKLEEEMRQTVAAVIIPSFLENRLIGFFVLGEKLSGHSYTPDDLGVFSVLASQAALAIENAQFYEEAKNMQEQISHAEKMATIGTMADGLSHQINNRFYALSLIAEDTIDTIKFTDITNCSPEVKDMVERINYALGRIKTNVLQGSEVVKGILRYTRKVDEGFVSVTLDQIIDGTLEMAQFKVKLSEFDIVRNYPKDIPAVKGNAVQLQEVFFNFIDNAYDAIVERRNFLKEEGYRGKMTVTATPKEDFLEVIFEDNGMGVKKDDIKKIFTPFFTTKVSSRIGTGLGLYVIRRIISDIHKGKISFESQYKTGTRFIIELPIVGIAPNKAGA